MSSPRLAVHDAPLDGNGSSATSSGDVCGIGLYVVEGAGVVGDAGDDRGASALAGLAEGGHDPGGALVGPGVNVAVSGLVQVLQQGAGSLVDAHRRLAAAELGGVHADVLYRVAAGDEDVGQVALGQGRALRQVQAIVAQRLAHAVVGATHAHQGVERLGGHD